MPKREQLLKQLQAEDDYGVFLMAQMGGGPNELQLIIQTARYDSGADGLRPQGQYVIRALGVQEQRISLGMFGKLEFVAEHPLLYVHNTTPTAVFFRGQPGDANELLLDISQAHASTFGPWRHFPDYINVAQPLTTFLASGGGLLGEMPEPLAERLVKVLDHHGLEHKLINGEQRDGDDGRESGIKQKLLLIDDSYVIAMDYSVEELGKV
jgi:hypothetical protein